MKKGFKGYLITGLLVVVPLYLSIYTFVLIVGFMDGVFTILPEALQPDRYLPFHLPGLGIIFTLLLVFIVGVIAQNFMGKALLRVAERMVGRIPVLRMVYNSTKQFMETFFSGESTGFRKVVMVQFPRSGIYSLGFLTGKTSGEIKGKGFPDAVNVFIPTTPNPTTGYYIVVSEKDIIPLDMRVEDAFKVIITGGIVTPNNDEFRTAAIGRQGDAGRDKAGRG